MNLTNVILNTRLLPINACIGGYIIWLMIGMQQPTTMHVQPQLCFYGTPENVAVQAPESIDIWIQSSRKTLHSIDGKFFFLLMVDRNLSMQLDFLGHKHPFE